MKPTSTAAAAKHPLIRAYILLFEEAPVGDKVCLVKEELARTFLAKALETHPDRATDTGRTRAEMTEKFRELEAAFKLLTEILGDQRMVMVQTFNADVSDEVLERLPPADLRKRRPERGWQARPTPKLLEKDVADLATMKARSMRQKFARAANHARAEKIYEERKAAESETAPPAAAKDPRPERVAPSKDKRFMLGRFLLKTGRITLRQLVDAVLWQRAQRPRAGEIAVEWGIMTRAEVFFVLREKTVEEMFCDVAVRLGFLTPFQRLAILARQRRLQSPIGQYFVEKGILEVAVVDEAAREAQRLAREAGALVDDDADASNTRAPMP